jgi:hypothetical protein
VKKRVQLHAKDVLCYQENKEYYLNRFPKRAKTEGMVYYFQKIDGVIIKTEILRLTYQTRKEPDFSNSF